MLIEAVAVFFGVAILFYCLFAGADFGAGILEIFRGRTHREKQQALIAQAIGPVWEANHVWLILAVVILFNGFPKAYSALSIIFHIPLTLVLLGVILRGCAFTFRNYDAVRDSSQRIYTFIFELSSVLTPLMLGVVAGATLLGRVASPGAGFVTTYVYPWLNVFSFAVGCFTCVLFAFLAAVYLTGEAKSEALREIFSRRARALNALAVLSGVVVFATADFDGLRLTAMFLAEPLSLGCMILATLVLVPLWVSLRRGKIISSRVWAGAQIVFILLGWFKLQLPVLISSRLAEEIMPVTLYNSAAPPATLVYLLYSLLIGSFFIFPALFFLLRIFKKLIK